MSAGRTGGGGEGQGLGAAGQGGGLVPAAAAAGATVRLTLNAVPAKRRMRATWSKELQGEGAATQGQPQVGGGWRRADEVRLLLAGSALSIYALQSISPFCTRAGAAVSRAARSRRTQRTHTRCLRVTKALRDERPAAAGPCHPAWGSVIGAAWPAGPNSEA